MRHRSFPQLRANVQSLGYSSSSPLTFQKTGRGLFLSISESPCKDQWFETGARSQVWGEKGAGTLVGFLASLHPFEASALSRGIMRTRSHPHQPSKWKHFQAALCWTLLMCFWVVMLVRYHMCVEGMLVLMKWAFLHGEWLWYLMLRYWPKGWSGLLQCTGHSSALPITRTNTPNIYCGKSFC